MAVAVNKVAQQFLNVQAGVAIPVAMQAFEASDIRVIYGITSQVAVQNVDYTISLANDFNTFTIVPTASLIAKIDALIIADPSEQNYITVRRELDLLTESTSALSRYTPFTSREHDRSAMRDQQLNDKINRSLQLGDRFVGGSPLLTLAELEPDRVLMVDPTGTQLIAGPNANEIENAQAYAERAEAAAAAVDITFKVAVYDTVAGISSMAIPPSVTAFRANGYSTIGDGGDGLYTRVGATPLTGPQIIRNSGFASATDWITSGAAVIEAGVARFTGTGVVGQNRPLVPNALYRCSFTITEAFASGGARMALYGNTDNSSPVYSQPGTYVTYLAAPSVPTQARVVSTGAGAVDNVYVAKVNPWQARDANGVWWERAAGQPLFPVQTLYVPHDFADMPAAFDFLRQRPVRKGQTIQLRLQAGYYITKGVPFNYDDFSQVRITSDDAQVPLASTFVGVNVTSDHFEVNSLFVGYMSKMPRLECLINMGTYGGCGYVVTGNSDGFIAGGCGVIYAGAFGLYVNTGSRCLAANSNFSLAGWGNRVTVNGFLSAPQANFSRARNATYLTVNTVANLDVSRGSVVYCTGTVSLMTRLNLGAGHGLAVRRSFVSATHTDCGQNGLNGLDADIGSVVAFTGSRAVSNTGSGISAIGGRVDANDGVFNTNGNYNIYADSGGDITARDCNAGGAGNQCVRAANGSRINISGANVRKTGVDGTSDIVATQGSIIHAVGAAGGTNTPTNALSSNGLIFK